MNTRDYVLSLQVSELLEYFDGDDINTIDKLNMAVDRVVEILELEGANVSECLKVVR